MNWSFMSSMSARERWDVVSEITSLHWLFQFDVPLHDRPQVVRKTSNQ